MNDYLKTAIQAAKAASKILNSGFVKGVKATDKNTSETGDWVTEYDYKAQAEILKIISKKFPSHNILSEEGVDENRNSDYKWIIDPLDGTTNFSHGFPNFASAIALEYKNKPFIGVIALPSQNKILWAQKNKGAFLNGKKISVSSTNKTAKALVGISMARSKEALNLGNQTFNKITLAPAKPRVYGSIAADLARVAMGQLDATVCNHLYPWDYLAGMLLVSEAGGKVTWVKNKVQFVASNKLLHKNLVSILK